MPPAPAEPGRDRHPVWGDALALGAGALWPLGFAPFGAWFLPPLALALLFGSWRDVTPRRACWRGWLFGLGMFGLGVSWVQISIHQFGLPHLAFSAGVTAVFVAFLALFPALTGYAARRWLGRRSGFALLLAWPALWTLSEWVRGWLLTGFPWLNVAYSQVDTPLGGWAPVGGVYLVCWLSALSAGGLCYLATGVPRARAWLLPVLVLLWGAGAVLRLVSWTEGNGEVWRVSLVQGNVAQSVKWEPAQREATVALYAELSAPHWRDQLIVWPETAVPAFPGQVAEQLAAIGARAEAANTTLLTGIPLTGAQAGRYHNGILALGEHAGGVYHKRHLVPFGEYTPLRGLLEGPLAFLDIPMSQFSPGAGEQPPVVVGDTALGLSICYEDAFGEEVIEALPDAGLLVNISNDAWFGDSIAPHQHLQIARMRALEAGRYLLRATNTGITAIIGPRGQLLAEAPQFEQTVLTGHVALLFGHTPYSAMGNLPVVLVALTVTALAAARRRRRRRLRPGVRAARR